MRKLAAVSGLVILVCALIVLDRDTQTGRIESSSGTHAGSLSPLAPVQSEAGARPSSVESSQGQSATETGGQVAQERESGSPEDAGESPALAATFAEFADEMQPTADGLAASTIDLWNSPAFLKLSVDDARALLPIDDDMGFRGPDSWVTLLGGLPTRADIDSAMTFAEVKCALEAACAQEMVYRELQMLPEKFRSVDYTTVLARAETAYTRSWELLMGTLDAKSKYHSWALLWRAWQRWSE